MVKKVKETYGLRWIGDGELCDSRKSSIQVSWSLVDIVVAKDVGDEETMEFCFF